MPTENVLSNGVMSIAVVNRKFVFFKVIDRESPITGVWVLDWVIYNRLYMLALVLGWVTGMHLHPTKNVKSCIDIAG